MSLKDDPEWKEFKKEYRGDVKLLFIIIFITFLSLVLLHLTANAQSTRITFSSAWDMEQQVNEIVAKCDTTWGDSVLVIVDTCSYVKGKFTSRQGTFVEPGEIIEITRRELVDVAVIKEPSNGDWFLASRYWLSIYDVPKMYELFKTDCRYGGNLEGDCPDAEPGEAIIWWGEVRR